MIPAKTRKLTFWVLASLLLGVSCAPTPTSDAIQTAVAEEVQVQLTAIARTATAEAFTTRVAQEVEARLTALAVTSTPTPTQTKEPVRLTPTEELPELGIECSSPEECEIVEKLGFDLMAHCSWKNPSGTTTTLVAVRRLSLQYDPFDDQPYDFTAEPAYRLFDNHPYQTGDFRELWIASRAIPATVAGDWLVLGGVHRYVYQYWPPDGWVAIEPEGPVAFYWPYPGPCPGPPPPLEPFPTPPAG